jgi:phosphotransferase system HPr (HPr) family protein
MRQKVFTVKSDKGLTSRASAALVSEANKYKCELTLFYLDDEANLKSIMNVMGLMIKKNAEFKVITDGVDEDIAIERIETILKDTRVI